MGVVGDGVKKGIAKYRCGFVKRSAVFAFIPYSL